MVWLCCHNGFSNFWSNTLKIFISMTSYNDRWSGGVKIVVDFRKPVQTGNETISSEQVVDIPSCR
jgi:hypothetical protein